MCFITVDLYLSIFASVDSGNGYTFFASLTAIDYLHWADMTSCGSSVVNMRDSRDHRSDCRPYHGTKMTNFIVVDFKIIWVIKFLKVRTLSSWLTEGRGAQPYVKYCSEGRPGPPPPIKAGDSSYSRSSDVKPQKQTNCYW